MKCEDIGFGTYNCAYNIMLPWTDKYVAVDKCLLPEVLTLWELGIKTTGCCCGHGKQGPFIGVTDEFIPVMKAMGYVVAYNSCRPDDEDSFVPKTEFIYWNAEKGFNWWDNE